MKIKLLSRANSAWLLLAGAIVLALLMSFAVLRYLQERERTMQEQVVQRSQGGPKITVVVPMRDVPAGGVVTRDVFVSRPIEADLVYPDMIKVTDFDAVANRQLLHPVLKGRPLRIADVAGENRSLAMSIPVGFRAITIASDVNNSQSNMMQPGDLVDLYLLATPIAPTGGPGATTKQSGSQDAASLLLQRVQILATGRRVYNVDARTIAPVPGEQAQAPGGAEYDTLTLLASPEQAARIALAQKVGTLRAVLRGGKDRDSLTPSILVAGELFPSTNGDGVRLQSVQYIVGGQGDAAITDRTPPALAGALGNLAAAASAQRQGAGASGSGAGAGAATQPAVASQNAPAQLIVPGARGNPNNTFDSSLFFPKDSSGRR